MSLTLEAPVPETFGWELISLVSDYINDYEGAKIVEIRDDKLIIHDCRELGRIIADIINKHVDLCAANVFIGGNDFSPRVANSLANFAKLAGLPSKPSIPDLIIRYGKMMQQKGCRIPALTNLYRIPDMLNANFYEYGRGYLKKPTKRDKPKQEISGGAILLGYLGGLLCYAGYLKKPETKMISYYFLPNRRVIDWDMTRELASGYRQLVSQDYSDASILIYLTSIIFEKGVVKSDTSFGSMVSLQEDQRCTILSVNAVHTSGLIKLMNRVISAAELREKDVEKSIASKIRSLISAPMRVGGEERNALMGFVERFSSYLLAYASTESLEPLSLLVDLLNRAIGDLQIGSRSALSNGLKTWAKSKNSDAVRELKSLINIFSSVRLRA